MKGRDDFNVRKKWWGGGREKGVEVLRVISPLSSKERRAEICEEMLTFGGSSWDVEVFQ